MLHKDFGKSIFAGKKVLELGSGPGLGGFIVSKWASQVILTDYQDLVLELLESNIAGYNKNGARCEMLVAELDWLKMRQV